MSEDQMFILGEQTFGNVVQQIKSEQLELSLPEWFELGRSQDRAKLKLRDILNYHAYDTAWVSETFAGKTVKEVGDKYDGDLLGNDPLGKYQEYSQAAIAAIKNNYDPDRTVHFSYGDYPAKEAILHVTSFRIFRAYDLAKLIGAETALPADLAEAAHKLIEPHADEWRQYGIFKPAQPVPDDADPQAKLFAMAGRDPNWR
ncbi:MAG TPA: TIGR03086 family metal-binding protein [Verrucomicrobiae bacterium]|nr:TIGR03086 family metal-binding protein [Verrucomicrobiae bacterium]